MQTFATVVIPITGDRGALLRYSLESVLRQTVRELEVFIIGDGVAEPTRRIIKNYEAEDSRVCFFDHPKHARRGEVYRHQALSAEANGEIVCYLCDRDYMLPDHVATMLRCLEKADFCHTLRFVIRPDDSIRLLRPLDLCNDSDRRATIRTRVYLDGLPLSTVTHRLSAYRSLPFGWRTTPKLGYTDHHMWVQFLEQPECRTVSSFEPTILYFPRGEHPGWPVEMRLRELERWHEKMQEPGWAEAFRQEVLDSIYADWTKVTRRERRRLTSRLASEVAALRRNLRRSLHR